MDFKKVLFVVAHADDEVLGAGATISKLLAEGVEVTVYIMTSGCPTRQDGMTLERVCTKGYERFKKANQKINVIFGDFDCLQIDKQNHYKIVSSIEHIISKVEPDIVFTHHPAGINPDHNAVAKACQQAVRLPQRQIPKYNHLDIKALYYMYVQSSTDWSLDVSLNNFKPDTFVEVKELNVRDKVHLLENYQDVIRPTPHPRSVRTILAQMEINASIGGCKSGLAEAFQTGFRRGL